MTGSLKMTEKSADGQITCNSTDNTSNTATCATINKYGGTATPIAPGGSQTTTIKISNTGTIPATSFTVKGGTCASTNMTGAAASGTGNLCDKMNVEIKSGATTIFTGTAKSFETTAAVNILAKISKAEIAKGAEETFTIKVSLPADAGNEFQGKQISQPITWQFGA